MHKTLPGARRLVITWGILMGLTLVSMLSAQLFETKLFKTKLFETDVWQALPLWGALLVLISTGFKAHQVLMVYLNLRTSSTAWKGAFVGLALLTLALILSGYLAARYQLLG